MFTKIIAYAVAFSICSVIGQTFFHALVIELIRASIITNADVGATIVTIGYILCGLIGVGVVALVYRAKGKKDE